MLVSPHRGEGFWYVEIAEADRIEDWNIKLQIVARSEVDIHTGICGFENQFFDECSHVAIADDAEAIRRLGACAHTAGVHNVDANTPACLLNRIGSEAAADGRSRGRSIRQIESPIVLGALNHLADHQTLGKMDVTVGAHSIGGVEFASLVAIEREGLSPMVKADYFANPQIGCFACFHPAFRIGFGW